jgi:hypothetical protein
MIAYNNQSTIIVLKNFKINIYFENQASLWFTESDILARGTYRQSAQHKCGAGNMLIIVLFDLTAAAQLRQNNLLFITEPIIKFYFWILCS